MVCSSHNKAAQGEEEEEIPAAWLTEYLGWV